MGRPDHPRRGMRLLSIVLADACAINLAFAAAYWLRYKAELGGPVSPFNYVPYRVYAPWGLVLTGVLVVVYWLAGLYSRRRRQPWLDSMYAVATGTVVGVALLIILIFGLRPLSQSRLMLPYAAALVIVLVGVVRLIDLQLMRRRLRRSEGVTRTVIIGAGEAGRAVMRTIVAQPDLGYLVLGFLDDDPAKQSQAIGRFEPLGGTDDLPAVLETHGVDEVIMCLDWQARNKIVRLSETCEAAGVRARIVPDLFQLSLNRVDIHSLGGIPLIGMRDPAIRGWHYGLKRAIDIALAVFTLVLAAPLLAAIALAIRLDSPGPVIYRQQRVGRGGRPFTLTKFRSMVEDADAARAALGPHNEASGPIFKMRRDPRLTRVGRVIRRLSLDELPQLWCVLRGDMSLVGPRPPMPREVESYADWHHRRLEIAPGMTGLWQVSGRSELTFDEMVMLDLFYAENWSLGSDVRILLRTVPTVLLGTGAY